MWRLFSSLFRLFSGPPDFTQPDPPGSDDKRQQDRPQDRPARNYPKLTPTRYRRPRLQDRAVPAEIVDRKPYRLARPYAFSPGSFLDLTQGENLERLQGWNLPRLTTPEDLADWLEIPLGHVAWLTNRFAEAGRAVDNSKSHYRYAWKAKRRGGYRLIEAPLPMLKQVQEQIHDDILSFVPAHPSAHGFCADRSILTNAIPHVGQAVVAKFDLDNFYTRVRYSRVVAVFRALGYNREIASWLAQLTTTAIPSNTVFPTGSIWQYGPLLARHLPQGAPTSPALANLVAYGLDVRLAGLARTFNANYTRYGDDMTFSGDEKFRSGLRLFLPLVMQIIRQERFQVQYDKRQVLRPCSRQTVTGVVVNEKPNISRKDYDRLKATLHNCVKTGPEAQNRTQHPDFRAHLRGRIAFVQQLNPDRGEKLLAIYRKIRWP